jgi:hypothetical protein
MPRLLSSKLVVGAIVVLVTTSCDRTVTSTTLGGGLTGPTGTLNLAGPIEGVGPNTITLAGYTIRVDAQTVIRQGAIGLVLSDLTVGARSRVTALWEGDTLRATLVDVEDHVGSATQLRGVIHSVAGDGNSFQFRMGSQLIRGDRDTQVFDGPRAASFAALRDGLTVDVNGLQRAEHVYAADVTVRPADSRGAPSAPSPTPAPGPSPEPSPPPSPSPSPAPPSNPVTVAGVIGLLNGVCPSLVLGVNGSAVVTNESTSWVGGACTSLAPGASIEATGTRNGNAVVARQVAVK